MSHGLRYGEVCRARCGAPARYLGVGGKCLFVSATCNDLCHDDARPPDGEEMRFPLPSDEALRNYREVWSMVLGQGEEGGGEPCKT